MASRYGALKSGVLGRARCARLAFTTKDTESTEFFDSNLAVT